MATEERKGSETNPSEQVVIHHNIELGQISAHGTPKAASKTVVTMAESKDVSAASSANPSVDFSVHSSSSSSSVTTGGGLVSAWKASHLPQIPFAQHELALQEEVDYSSRDYQIVQLPKVISDSSLYNQTIHCLPIWLEWPLFYYPYNVNEWTCRFIALFAMGIAIAGIIERSSFQMRYVLAALWIDYVAQFAFGPRGSLLGVLAECCSYWLPRKYVPGAPRQFAAFCGAVFTGVATAVWFWASNSHNGNHTGGAVVVGVFLGAVALECFLGISLGAWLFVLMTRCGMISESWMRKSEVTFEEYRRTSSELETRLKEPKSEKVMKIYEKIQLNNYNGRIQQHPLVYKAYTDAQKREDYNPIKHTTPTYFAFPMAVAGLATVYKLCAGIPDVNLYTYTWPNIVYYIVSIVSAGIGIPLLFLYLIKAIVYPHKVVKDMSHPTEKNMFCCITIMILLWSFLAINHENMLAEVLFWVSGPLQLFISVLLLGDFIRYSHDWYIFNPIWLMGPIGNLVAAFVLPFIHCGRYSCEDYHYVEAAYLWFGIGTFMWIIFTTLGFIRTSFFSYLSDDLRPSIFLFICAPALVCSSFVAINGLNFPPFAIATLFISIVFVWVCLYLAFFAYFARQKFNMFYWIYAFPLDAIAIATLLYYSYHQSNETFHISSTAVVITSGIHVLFTAHTILGMITGTNGVWVPRNKLSPLSLIRLQHYSFREGLNLLDKAIHFSVHTNENKTKQLEQIQFFINEWRELNFVIEEHMKQEEEVIFRHFRHLFPGITMEADQEHDRDSQHSMKISELLNKLENYLNTNSNIDSNNRLDNMLNEINIEFQIYSKNMKNHMDFEEIHLNFISQKYMSEKWQREIIREMYLRTYTNKWPRIFVYILSRQWMHERRVQILQSFQMAFPERMQTIGRMLYENLDPFLYERLTVDIPEMIPRHAPGYYKSW